MISVERFLAPSSMREDWLEARRGGVTATQVAKAATPAGLRDVLAEIDNPVEIEDNAYMKFGRDNEEWIVLSLKEQFGVLPNNWLIAHETERWQMATPDGISLDHARIAEVKTTGRDWREWSKVPIHYRRQVAWQLHVSGAEECVFAWVLRDENKFGDMIPVWFEPKVVVVQRDEKMISELVRVADTLHAYMSDPMSVPADKL